LNDVLEEQRFTEYKPFDVSLIRIDPAVRKLCEANACGSYGRNHMCPPSVDGIDKWRDVIMGFDQAMIVSKMYTMEKKYDMEVMFEGARDFEVSLRNARESIEEQHPDVNVMILGAGPCMYCKRCSKLNDLPCVHPDKAYPSVEACGIDVMSLSKDTDVKYNNGANTVTYFGLVLYSSSSFSPSA
jgi:predicted metal-binding protein